MTMKLNYYNELPCCHAVGVDKLGIIGELVKTTLSYPAANVLNQVLLEIGSQMRRGTDLLALLRKQLLPEPCYLIINPC